MTGLSRRSDLWRVLDGLRDRGERLTAVRLATAGNDAGLPIDVVLDGLGSFATFGRPNESRNVLQAFVTALGEALDPEAVLETGELGSVLAAQLLGRRQGLNFAYVTKNADVAEALTLVLGQDRSRVVETPSELDGERPYPLIIAQPPIGHRSGKDREADGFGGETIRPLISLLGKEGALVWVTARGALWNAKSKSVLELAAADGWHVHAAIEVPQAFVGTSIDGAVLVLRRGSPKKKLVAALRDAEASSAVAAALLTGPKGKAPPNSSWIDPEDPRSFADIEQERHVQRLMPRGRYTLTPLRDVLLSDRIERADRDLSEGLSAATFLYLPEYVASRATADLDEQSVKPKAVYRVALDPNKVNAEFLARMLNSEYGKYLRATCARGATIQRLSVRDFLDAEIPLPDLKTQGRIAQIHSDVGAIRAALEETIDAADRDWRALDEVAGALGQVKSVYDIDRRVAEWWRELPYPIATIYKRYQVATDAKERLQALLHFFEVSAVYISTIGISHLQVLHEDGESAAAKMLRPERAAGIERADFGFWINLALSTFKEIRRTTSDKDRREAAIAYAGPDLVDVATAISPLGDGAQALNRPREFRNAWTAHGGLIKKSDAARLEQDLQTSLRDFYTATSTLFRRLRLVRTGRPDVGDDGFIYEVDRLAGSDPTFEKAVAALVRPMKSHALAFWLNDAPIMCLAAPFFRLGAPHDPQETTIYVYNRTEGDNFRWVSYQAARDQEVIDADEELTAWMKAHPAPTQT